MERNSEEEAILVAQTGPLNGQRWLISKRMIIGRDDDCDIVVADRQVSRQHAAVFPSNTGIILEDLHSKNGTHHNGLQFEEPIYLQDGDTIQIALAQQFVFLSSDATLPLESGSMSSSNGSAGVLHLDKRSRRVWIGNQEVIPPLSVSQFVLLECLYENQGRVVPRRELIRTVWGEEQAVLISEQALDALVRRLRDRLANVDPNHAYVVTVRGHGLRLDNPSS